MSAITQQQLAKKLEAIYDELSDKTDVSPAEARKKIAEKQAEAIAQFVIGRTTSVTGTSVSGGNVTGTGTIK